jgi:putative RNA 2'-phosphotransferase
VIEVDRELVQVSKFLSLLLRHRPQTVGLVLDEQGWVDVNTLLEAIARSGRGKLDRVTLERVVAQNDKQRFAFSDDGLRIRASQGHSLREVDLALEPQDPPERLFAGTATRFLESIRQQGLLPQKRNHVHLTTDAGTALTVGRRHGEPVVLQVLAGRMHIEGHAFFLSDNGVWLTAAVPPAFLVFPTGGEADTIEG